MSTSETKSNRDWVARDDTPLTKWLRKNTVAVAGALVFVGFSFVMWQQMSLSEELVEVTAVQDAAKFNHAVQEFRTIYTSEVVTKAKAAGLKITHDYKDHSDAIPLPATLSMMLGDRLGEHESQVRTRLYSDFPFPWRTDGGPQDDFERDALAALRKNPDEPFFRFSSLNGEPVIRYATADLMRESCVNCHNTHADTPKSGWKVGDVRGVLAVTVPMKNAVAQTHASVRSQFYGLAGCGGLVLCFFAFAVVRMSRHSESIEVTNRTLHEQQQELKAQREGAEQARAQLQIQVDKSAESRRAALNLMADMEEARDVANAASHSKSDFLANMSHEIRTPMTAILGFGEVLMNSESSAEECARAVETINRNGHHLLDLINNILDVSKIEVGLLEVEQDPCSPLEVAHDVCDLLSIRAEEKSLDLRVTCAGRVPREIVSDGFRLKQALVNLVGNAIKFTTSGSIEIRLRCSRSTGRLTFEVIDTGIGMTDEQAAAIFQPFSQADSTMTRRFGGTGLGLTITREIARLLGGEASVTSEPGVGSTFSLSIETGPLDDVAFVLSVDEVVAAPPSTQPESVASKKSNALAEANKAEDSSTDCRADASKKQLKSIADNPQLSGRILVVEDGPDNQILISFLLRKAGSEVEIAENGARGVEQALASREAGQPYDLIIMDMQMPVMDGYAATTTLRDSGWTGPIVALTAHALKEEAERCLAAGCDAYLRKPIERPEFFAVIGQYLHGVPSESRVPAEQ
jgi:signal transduction histidine kinase/ActR/RegA family two-component response regulator